MLAIEEVAFVLFGKSDSRLVVSAGVAVPICQVEKTRGVGSTEDILVVLVNCWDLKLQGCDIRSGGLEMHIEHIVLSSLTSGIVNGPLLNPQHGIGLNCPALALVGLELVALEQQSHRISFQGDVDPADIIASSIGIAVGIIVSGIFN
jgi:hypothetical protein